MKRFSEQLQNKANSVKLRVSEKRDLRERVVSYMEYHPMPISVRQLGATAESEQVKLVHVSLWRILQLSGAALGVLLLSITYLAEQAIPGDSLYAVKVGFNEEVRSTLARSPYEKVVWETERLNRRISEARLLASEGRLTEEVEQDVADAVREHSDNARKEIEVLKQTDVEEAALASIQLATAIDMQSTSLKNNDSASTTVGMSTSRIASALAESQETEANKQEDTLPSYTKLMAKVESETTRAYELLSNIHDLATPEEKSDIQRRLEDIERSVSDAVTQASAEDTSTRKLLVDALQRTQRLIVFMTNIDVRKSLTIEQIVPVKLTAEERTAKVKKLANETLALVTLSEQALGTFSTGTTASTTASTTKIISPDREISAKLIPALKESKTTAKGVLGELLKSDFDLPTLEEQIKTAYAVANDSATLLSIDRSSLLDIKEEKVILEIATSSPEISGDYAGTSTPSAVETEI